VYPYAALECSLYRVGIVDVTGGVSEVGAEPRAGSLDVSDQQSHVVPVGQQPTSDRPADFSGATDDEDRFCAREGSLPWFSLLTIR
jgi:hypothetical protein